MASELRDGRAVAGDRATSTARTGPGRDVQGAEDDLRPPNAEQKAAGAKWDKTKIIYNSHVTISNIPLEAYDYVVNGKPAIEWIMERYQCTRDKDSGIVNDPNDWCREHNQPRYIIDLIAARGRA